MNLDCVLKKFCEDFKPAGNRPSCISFAQANLASLKVFLQESFIEKALGNVGMATLTFKNRRLVKTVLLSLSSDIDSALNELIYTEILKSSGVESSSRMGPVRWKGEDGFDLFRSGFADSMRLLLPFITDISDREIVPNQAYSSETIEKLFEYVKKAPFKYLQQEIDKFCNGGSK